MWSDTVCSILRQVLVISGGIRTVSEAKANSKAVVWVVGAVAVVAIVFLLVYGGSGRLHLELPFGVGAEMAGERAAPPPRGSVSGVTTSPPSCPTSWARTWVVP